MHFETLLKLADQIVGETPNAFIKPTLYGRAKRLSIMLVMAHLTDIAKTQTGSRLPIDLMNSRNIVAHATDIDSYMVPTQGCWQYFRTWINDINHFTSENDTLYEDWQGSQPVWVSQTRDEDRLASSIQIFRECQEFMDALDNNHLSQMQRTIYQLAIIFNTFHLGQLQYVDEKNHFQRYVRNHALKGFINSLKNDKQKSLYTSLLKKRDSLIHCDLDVNHHYHLLMQTKYEQCRELICNIIDALPMFSRPQLKTENIVSMSTSYFPEEGISSETKTRTKQYHFISRKMIDNIEESINNFKAVNSQMISLRNCYLNKNHIFYHTPVDKLEKSLKHYHKLFDRARAEEHDTDDRLAFHNTKFINYIKDEELYTPLLLVTLSYLAYMNPAAANRYVMSLSDSQLTFKINNVLHNPLLIAVIFNLSDEVLDRFITCGYTLDAVVPFKSVIIPGTQSLLAWTILHPVCKNQLTDIYDKVLELRKTNSENSNLQFNRIMARQHQSLIRVLSKTKIKSIDGAFPAAVTLCAPVAILRYLIQSGYNLNQIERNSYGGDTPAWIWLIFIAGVRNPKFNFNTNGYLDLVLEANNINFNQKFTTQGSQKKSSVSLFSYFNSFQIITHSLSLSHQKNKDEENCVFIGEVLEKLVEHIPNVDKLINHVDEYGNTALTQCVVGDCSPDLNHDDQFACSEALKRFKAMLMHPGTDFQSYVYSFENVLKKRRRVRLGSKLVWDKADQEEIDKLQKIKQMGVEDLVLRENNEEVTVGTPMLLKFCITNDIPKALALINAAKARGLESLKAVRTTVKPSALQVLGCTESIKALLSKVDNLIHHGEKLEKRIQMLKSLILKTSRLNSSKNENHNTDDNTLHSRLEQFQTQLQQAETQYKQFLDAEFMPEFRHTCDGAFAKIHQAILARSVVSTDDFISSEAQRLQDLVQCNMNP